MATFFQYDCPHCHSRKASFTIGAQHHRREVRNESYLFGVCGVCDRPSIFWYVDVDRLFGGRPTSLTQRETNVQFPGELFTIITCWPEGTGDVPENIPDHIARYYQQGVQNEGAENWDAAGAMFRKTLDVATKVLDPDLAKKNLFDRINELAKQGRLTSDISESVSKLRLSVPIFGS